MTQRIPDRDRFSERELARALDKHVSTVIRWRLRGVRGVKLPSYLVGGRRYIDRSALMEFFRAINMASGSASDAVPGVDHRRQFLVEQALDSMGV